MNKLTKAIAAASLLVVGLAAGHVLATGAPVQTPLTYAGTITDATGKPYATAQDVKVSFYDAASGGSLKCQSGVVQAEAGSGRFAAVLPADCAQAVHDTADLWVQAAVGVNQAPLPRLHVGAVPYALQAEVAKLAVTANSASAAGGALKVALDGTAADVGKLKSAVDGVVADVAALKKAPGGTGGGPAVVDAKGMKLGTLLSLQEWQYFVKVVSGQAQLGQNFLNPDLLTCG